MDFGITLGCIGFWYYFGVGAQFGILSRGDPIPICEPMFTSSQMVSLFFTKVIHEHVLLPKAMRPLIEIKPELSLQIIHTHMAGKVAT